MKENKTRGIIIRASLSFIFAVLNIGLYITTVFLMGFKWQIGLLGRFIKGNPMALGLIWSNYSPLVFGILLVYMGKCLLKRTNIGFIKGAAITYLVINTLSLFTNIVAIIFTFPNMLFFITLLVFISRPKVKIQYMG